MKPLREFHLDYLAWTLETHGHRSVRHTHALCDTLMLLAVVVLAAHLPGPFGVIAAVVAIALGFVGYFAFDPLATLLVTGVVALGLVAARALDSVVPASVALALWGTVFVVSVSAAILSHILVREQVRLYPPSVVGSRRILAFAIYGGFLPLFGAYYQTTLFLVDLGRHAKLASEARSRVGTGLAPLL
jgi:hypothetical protein